MGPLKVWGSGNTEEPVWRFSNFANNYDGGFKL